MPHPTIGVPWHILEDGVDSNVRTAFSAAIDMLRRQGAKIVDVPLPHATYAVPTYYVVAPAEASSNLARYDGVRFAYRAPLDAAHADLTSMYNRTRDSGFGAEVKRRIMLGTYALSAGYYDAYYLKAQQIRTLIRRDYNTAFEQVDAVATPTTPTPAFGLGERSGDPLQLYVGDVFTASANLTGLPAISLPCGFVASGLPVGLQLTGRAFRRRDTVATRCKLRAGCAVVAGHATGGGQHGLLGALTTGLFQQFRGPELVGGTAGHIRRQVARPGPDTIDKAAHHEAGLACFAILGLSHEDTEHDEDDDQKDGGRPETREHADDQRLDLRRRHYAVFSEFVSSITS